MDAESLYVALISNPGRLSQLRRLTYRCAKHRCLLLDVVETPLGVVLHQKRFKQSAEVNEGRSNEAGRAKNTFDGDNHWKPRTYWLNESALSLSDDPRSNQPLNCDHVGPRPGGLRDSELGVQDVVLRAQDFAADWSARHAEVRVQRDGSRYAV